MFKTKKTNPLSTTLRDPGSKLVLGGFISHVMFFSEYTLEIALVAVIAVLVVTAAIVVEVWRWVWHPPLPPVC